MREKKEMNTAHLLSLQLIALDLAGVSNLSSFKLILTIIMIYTVTTILEMIISLIDYYI